MFVFLLIFLSRARNPLYQRFWIAQNSHQKTLVVWSQKYQLVQGLHRAKVRYHVKNFFHFSIIIPDFFPGEASRMRAADALWILVARTVLCIKQIFLLFTWFLYIPVMIIVLVFRQNYQHFVGKQPAENGYQPDSLFGAWSDPPELYALHLGMIFHIFVQDRKSVV